MTPDQRLRSTARNLDHEDPGAALAALSARSRVEGPDVWLEALADRETWNRTPAPVQDAAIAEAGRRLVGFELKGARSWSCENGPCPDPVHSISVRSRMGLPCSLPGCHMGRRSISHRLGLFRHRPTGMEFSLIPGWRSDMVVIDEGEDQAKPLISIAPILVGRLPVTNIQADRVFRDDGGTVATFSYGNLPPRDLGDGYLLVNPRDDDLPHTGSIHEAITEHLNKHGLRLPSPAEWDHACRAGSVTRFPWGDEMDDSFCWHAENSAGCPTCGRVYQWGETLGGRSCCQAANPDLLRTRPRAPSEHDSPGKWNAFGLIDMVGNVWEWLIDGQIIGACFSSPDPSSWTSLGPTSTNHVMDREIGFRAICSIPGPGGRTL